MMTDKERIERLEKEVSNLRATMIRFLTIVMNPDKQEVEAKLRNIAEEFMSKCSD